MLTAFVIVRAVVTVVTTFVALITIATVITVAAVVLTLTAVLLTFRLGRFWLFFRLLWLNFLTGKHLLQRAEEAAQQTRLRRLGFRGRRFWFLRRRFGRWFFQGGFRWGFWHDEGR